MKTLFFAPLWGATDIPFESFLEKSKSAGYDGVELPFLTMDETINAERISLVENYGLKWIGQHWETQDPYFGNHKEMYLQRLKSMAIHGPMLINAHTGRDIFSQEQNIELIQAAEELSNHYKVKLIHETHRSRFNFAAHISTAYFDQLPGLKITADFSHWCCVAESLLADQQAAVARGIERAELIHSRVGYSQGPQIPDPRASEWNHELNIFLGWWDQIIARAKNEGREFFPITTEFGPYPYMPIVPHSKEPLADQWEVNVHMRDLLNERYNG